MLLMGFVHVWELGLTYNITRSYTVERQVWFTCMFVIDIYNEKSEDLSTIHLSLLFIFCPYAIIPPCNYICQIYLLKKEREREREKRKLLSFVCVLCTAGLCSSRARWPLVPNFCPRATRKSQIFHTNHMLGTLDFTDSEDWAPFNFP